MGKGINIVSITIIAFSSLLLGCESEVLSKETFEDDTPGNLPIGQSEPDRAFFTYSGIGTIPEEVGLIVIDDGVLDSTSLLLDNNRPPLNEVRPWNRPFIIFVSDEFTWADEERIFISWEGSINSGQSDSYLDIYSHYFNIRLADGRILLRSPDRTFTDLGAYVENTPHLFLV